MMPKKYFTKEQRAEKHRENLRNDYVKYHEARLASKREYDKNHPEQVKEKKKRYYERNKDKFRLWNLRTEARKKGLDPDKLYPIDYPRQIKRVLS